MSKYWWDPCAKLLPTWLAPNLVTLIGSIGQLIGFLVLTFECPTFSEKPSALACCIFAFATFFYQTMDAIDGKQARKTKTSSPLGQLFDHGCDCLCSAFLLLGVACIGQFGSGWKTAVVLLSIQVKFFSKKLPNL